MAAAKSDASWVVHYQSGQRSQPLAAAQIRDLIAAGEVGVDDRVSRDGGPAVAYYQYDEFVDLWDVDESFGFLGLDEEPGESAPSTPPPATPVPSATTHRVGARAPVELPPSPFLPTTAAPVDAAIEQEPVEDAEDLDLFAFEELEEAAPEDEGTREAAGPSAFDYDDELWVDDAPEPGALDAYAGYDPLADLMLDAGTVLDLMYDSSLYTVLAANPGERGEQIRARYLARAALLARRQRAVTRTDTEQVGALETLRRLIYRAYQVVLDESERARYEAAAVGGRPASAARFLDLEREASPAPAVGRPSPEELLVESLAELQSDAYEALGEQGASIGLNDEPGPAGEEEVDPFGIGEELARPTGPQSRVSRHAVDFTEEIDEEVPDSGEGLPGGLRIYSSVLDAIDSRSLDDIEPVGEIFEQSVPDRARRKQEAIRRTQERTAFKRTGERTLSPAIASSRAPEGLEWGAEDNPVPAVTQALGATAIVFFASLVVIFATDLGARELDYSGHSMWFYGRGLLLAGLALAGTKLVRGEPLTRLGLRVPFIESAMGVGLGVILGLLASFIAPVYLEGGASIGAAVVSMVFIALAHELFFRGFVTRVLLVGIRNAMTAIFIYGAFFLSYTWVLGQSGFYVLYYSVLIYGFGLGGVFAVLYWKSRSIWPSVLVHTLVLMLAMLLAP